MHLTLKETIVFYQDPQTEDLPLISPYRSLMRKLWLYLDTIFCLWKKSCLLYSEPSFCHWLLPLDSVKEGETRICYLTTEHSGQQVLSEEPIQWKWITMLKVVTSEPAWGSSGQAKQQLQNIRNVNISLTIFITKKSWCLSDIFLTTPVMSSGSKHMWIPNSHTVYHFWALGLLLLNTHISV